MRPWRRRTLRAARALLLPVAAVACLPLAPYSKEPGFYGSRSNLGDAAPPWVVAGRTTRSEVLATLGEPDIEAVDGRWLYYASDYLKAESGVWMLFVIPGVPAGWAGISRSAAVHDMLFRRLYIRVSAQGEVESMHFESQECSDVYPATSGFPSDGDVDNCPLLARDRELREQRHQERRQAAVPAGDTGTQWFDYALFRQGKLKHWLGINHALRCDAAASSNAGELAITDQSVVFLRPQTAWVGHEVDVRRIARAELAETRLIDGMLERALGVDLRLANGDSASFAICARDVRTWNDAGLNRRAFSLLQAVPP